MRTQGRSKRSRSSGHESSSQRENLRGFLQFERTDPETGSELEWDFQTSSSSSLLQTQGGTHNRATHAHSQSHTAAAAGDSPSSRKNAPRAAPDAGNLAFSSRQQRYGKEGEDYANPISPELSASDDSPGNGHTGAWGPSTGKQDAQHTSGTQASSAIDDIWNAFGPDILDETFADNDEVIGNVSGTGGDESQTRLGGQHTSAGPPMRETKDSTYSHANYPSDQDTDSPANLNLRREVESLRSQLEQKQGEIKIVRERLKQETERASELQDMVAVADLETQQNLADDKAKFERKLQQMKSEADFKDTELQETERQRERLSKQVAQQSKEVEELKKQLQEYGRTSQQSGRSTKDSGKTEEQEYWEALQGNSRAGAPNERTDISGDTIPPSSPQAKTLEDDQDQIRQLLEEYSGELSYMLLAASSTSHEFLNLRFSSKLVDERLDLSEPPANENAQDAELSCTDRGGGAAMSDIVEIHLGFARDFKSYIGDVIAGKSRITSVLLPLCCLAGLYSTHASMVEPDILDGVPSLSPSKLNNLVALRLCSLRVLRCLLTTSSFCRQACLNIRKAKGSASILQSTGIVNRVECSSEAENIEEVFGSCEMSESLQNLTKQLSTWGIGLGADDTHSVDNGQISIQMILLGICKFGRLIVKVSGTSYHGHCKSINLDDLVMMYCLAWQCIGLVVREDMTCFVKQLTTEDVTARQWDETTPAGTLFFGANGAIATGFYALGDTIGAYSASQRRTSPLISWVYLCLQHLTVLSEESLRLKYRYLADMENADPKSIEEGFRAIFLDIGPVTSGISKLLYMCSSISTDEIDQETSPDIAWLKLSILRSSVLLLVSLQHQFPPYASLAFAGSVTSQLEGVKGANFTNGAPQPPASWIQPFDNNDEEEFSVLAHMRLLTARLVVLCEEYANVLWEKVEVLCDELGEVAWRVGRYDEFKHRSAEVEGTIEPITELLKLSIAIMSNSFVDIGKPYLYRFHGWQGPLLDPSADQDDWIPDEAFCDVQVVTKTMHTMNSFRSALEKIHAMLVSLGYDPYREQYLSETADQELVQRLNRISNFGSGLRFMLELVDRGILNDIQGVLLQSGNGES
eukprot:gb/GECG01000834.1/.p1 GENE.gb/GECG01000834.1/~~gb/GECG01000834.1/.p1  ORF type:complete len:1093 (+),score=150.12 gb/GECG01000834.1/:1-3279(+)